MGDLHEYFSRKEFACKCGCGFDTVDAELLTVLIDLRKWAECEVIVTSGCRCYQHNLDVGGRPNSYHKLAKAADIVVEYMSSLEVWDYLCDKYPGKYGIQAHDGWVHVDVRPDEWREG